MHGEEGGGEGGRLYRFREKALDSLLYERQPEDGVDGGPLAWVVLQTGVNQRAKVFAVFAGHGRIGPPATRDKTTTI